MELSTRAHNVAIERLSHRHAHRRRDILPVAGRAQANRCRSPGVPLEWVHRRQRPGLAACWLPHVLPRNPDGMREQGSWYLDAPIHLHRFPPECILASVGVWPQKRCA